MPDCIFCKVISGELPCAKVYEDEHCFAFLDLFPVHPGHTLVVPKKHATVFLESDAQTQCKLMEAMHPIAKAVMEVTGADGCNISTNNGEAAGQTVFHVHWHIIPRYNGDGLKTWPQREYATDQDRLALAETIQQKL